MRLRNIAAIAISVVVSAVIISSCGGGSSSTAASAQTSTRALIATIEAPAAEISGAKVASYCSAVASAVATATDGTTVSDSSLADCSLMLDLVIGKTYVISFLDADGEFYATLTGQAGSLFPISAGSVAIDLQSISFSGGVATPSGNFLAYLDSDGDGIADAYDSTPCGGDDCASAYACAHYGYDDSDGDGICDAWDGRLPGSGDMGGDGTDGGGSGGGDSGGTGSMIADHSVVAAFSSIPQAYVNQALANFKIFYGHTSHGSQLVAGMGMLESENPLYDYGAMLQHEEGSDLGNPDFTSWAATTRAWLGAHPETNVVIWSWCGEVSSASAANIETYLSLMSQLESDYPDVIFTYMTGHTDGSGASGNLRVRNQQIRSYCSEHGKWLFDFEDVESWDLSGTYYPDVSDACEWCAPQCTSAVCLSCQSGDSCAHSNCFNCYQKGKAIWWLLARMAGWNG